MLNIVRQGAIAIRQEVRGGLFKLKKKKKNNGAIFDSRYKIFFPNSKYKSFIIQNTQEI